MKIELAVLERLLKNNAVSREDKQALLLVVKSIKARELAEKLNKILDNNPDNVVSNIDSSKRNKI